MQNVDSGDPTLENSLFGAAKLVNSDVAKSMYPGCDIGFDTK